jgi:hypothetical protein
VGRGEVRGEVTELSKGGSLRLRPQAAREAREPTGGPGRKTTGSPPARTRRKK